jgi:hypothetical protein
MNLARMGVSSFAVALGAMLSACLPPLVVPIAREDAGRDVAPTSDVMSPPPDAMAPPDILVPPDAVTPPDTMPVPTGAGSVDLLLVIDNSNSMLRAQDAFQTAVGQMVSTMLRDHGVTDVRVGVISTDLGTPGSVVPSCANSDLGDDGRLNPRAFGLATRTRPLAPVTAEIFCPDPARQDPFVTVSRADDAMTALWRPTCHMSLGIGGCGIEQQLEATRRALLGPRSAGARNEGFLRPEATLAILMLTDEEDGSVRDCRYAEASGPCSDAIDVFDVASTRWGSPDLNLRFYDYDPGSAQDPTWPLERYVDPARPTRGLLSLKPGHPERIVFGAITGVPVAIPRTPGGLTDWGALVGAPASGRADDFLARNASLAYRNPMAPGGEVSMRQRDRDPLCSTRMIPACRNAAVAPTPACTPSEQPFAWRARRIAEVARRFDESALCNGSACRNGMVASICSPDDTAPFTRFAAMVGRRAR